MSKQIGTFVAQRQAGQCGPVVSRHGESAARNVDLLRLGLAALVLLSHSYELIDGNRSREPLTRLFHSISTGDLAVDCFFALSGFLISQSWERAPRIGTFLRKRITRIYPGFVTASLISILIVGPLGAASAAYWSQLSIGKVVTDLALLSPPPTPPVFAGSNYPEVNAPLWTISYEFACYVGLMLLGACGLLRRRAPILLLWGASVAAFLLLRAELLDAHPSGTITGYQQSTARFSMLFLSGVVFSRFRLHHLRHPLLPASAALAVLLGLSSALLAEPAVAVAGTYLILLLVPPSSSASGVSRLPDLSYGTYLYGWPIQKLLIFAFPAISPMPLFVASATLAMGCAAVSWKLVEQPALARRSSRAHRNHPAAERAGAPAPA